MEILIILAGILALILSFASARTFSIIASMKGHNDAKYFWWTFFIPLLGALMVIALPDRKKPEISIMDMVVPVTKEDEPPLHTPENRSSETHPIIVDPIPTETDGKIACPVCGTLQKSNRDVCWTCGTQFNKH